MWYSPRSWLATWPIRVSHTLVSCSAADRLTMVSSTISVLNPLTVNPVAHGVGSPVCAAASQSTLALAKNPGGYCGLGGTGVSCPVGLGAS